MKRTLLEGGGQAKRASHFAGDLLLRLAVVFLLVQLIAFYKFFVDDAFISFRYARNLVIGNGLVFNPGCRVEGYSNFLWVVALAGINWLGVDVVLASKLLGFGSIVSVIALSYALYQRLPGRDSVHASGVALLLASSLPIVYFGIAGMETTFFSAWLVAAVYIFVAHGNRLTGAATLCICAAALTRPDGVLYFPVALIAESFESTGVDRRKVGSVVPFGAVYAIWILWRRGYYGDWLPNTFYAKLPSNLDNPIVSGLDEPYRFVLTNGGPLFLVPKQALGDKIHAAEPEV